MLKMSVKFMKDKNRGKDICNYLRNIRIQVAKEHGIDYVPAKCYHGGDCTGTCFVCAAFGASKINC